MTSLKQKYSETFKKAREIKDTKGTKSPGNGQTCHNPSSSKELDKIPQEYLCKYDQRGNETAGLTVYFLDVVWDKEKFTINMVTQNVKNRKIVNVNISIPKTARKGDWIETNNNRRLTVRTVFTQLLVSLHEYFRKKGMPYDSLFEMYQQYGDEFTMFNKVPKYFKDTWELLNNNENSNNNENNDNNNNDNNNENNNENNENNENNDDENNENNNNDNNNNDNNNNNENDDDIKQEIEIN